MTGFDEVTGNFPGWQYVSAGAGLILLAAAVFMFLRFMKALKEHRLYSFRTVAMLGFALYFLTLAVFNLRYFIRYGDDGTFYLFLVAVIFSPRYFMIFMRPLFILFSLSLLASNLVLIKKEGFFPGNLYAGALALLLTAAEAAGIIYERNIERFFLPNWLVNSFNGLCCYLGCLFLAVVICALIAALRNPDPDKDYVLILGCRIRDDGTLYPIIRGRAERAMEFIRMQREKTGKQAVFLPSGGKGSDECLSEAEAVERFLLENNIPPENILTETQSTTTRENMLFSRRLIDDDAKVAFSTSDFHVFRSGILASSLGWNIDGIGARTKWYFWPNAFAREFIALLAAGWKSHIAMTGIIIAFMSALTLLIYI